MIAMLLAAALAVPPVQGDGLEVRFVEAGEFRFSDSHGAEVDLVNTGRGTVTCGVRLLLQRENPATGAWTEVQRTEVPAVALPPRARAGFRVLEPSVAARCRVEYEVVADGKPFARGQFEFVAAGPYQVSLRPFFLSKDGVAIRVVGRAPPPPNGGPSSEKYRFKLVDPRNGKVLARSDEFRVGRDTEAPPGTPPRAVIEGFLSFKGQPPGRYLIEVEVRSPNGKPAAVARLATRFSPPGGGPTPLAAD